MQGLARISAADAAARLREAGERSATLEAFTAQDAGFDLDRAYQAQEAVTRERVAGGWRVIGRKIGFTNRDIWPLYGVDAPMWAPVFDRSVIFAGEHPVGIALQGIVQPRIEPEILFRLASPVPAGLTRPDDVLPHVEGYAHSIEIVHSHFHGWKARLPDFCADQACHSRLVVGPLKRVDAGSRETLVAALADCSVRLCRNGEVALEGRGANALGHLLLALAHLAEVLAGRGAPPLAAGELISNGTLTDAPPVAAGERWSTQFAGIDVQDLAVEFAP